LARFGVELLGAALAARGRRIVVADRGESPMVVRDMIWVRAGVCARRCGRGGAGDRALCVTGNVGCGLAA
jgi:putative resolvase